MAGPAEDLDTLVVGAGPAGIGVALALAAVEGLTFGVVERGQVGQTFLDWPERQTFLTPSFTGNGFGATDLNAVHPETSPAFTLGVDYLSGPQYAAYLHGVASYFQIPVLDGTDVVDVRPRDSGFEVSCSRGVLHVRTLIWAGGEFHQPLVPDIPGRGLTDHSSRRPAWEPREGEVVVIGGFESGIDIACHHAARGARVSVIDERHPWDAGIGSDPSFRLAPRTRMRLAQALATERLELVGASAVEVTQTDGGYTVALGDGKRVTSGTRPISATGFGPGLGPVKGLFERRPDGWPVLDDDDQSTIAPGLFLSGPSVRHDGLQFCFVYKFRQRFAHIARAVGERLGKKCDALEAWRSAGMLADDLSCCGAECAC